MKKSERKLEARIVEALNNVCDELTADSAGFRWITHFVDVSNVSQSLRIVCVYDKNAALEAVKNERQIPLILRVVKLHLENEGFSLLPIKKIVLFDTEENGADVSKLSWCRKFSP